ncbi:MAG: efflux RND transporter periplasmic adaptor subunit [Actinobacteria bacterium]|nr:efflux RND transporter periplasmic adaptor subunit [Actinomycetota bacterium]
MTVRRWIVAVLVVLVVVGMAVASLRPRPEPPVEVQTAKAARMTVTRSVRSAGKLEPHHKVNVSSNITGVLIDLSVGIGSVVKKGQYLGQIETTRYLAVVQQTRARLQAAESDIVREEATLKRLRNVMQRIEKESGNAFNVGEREKAQTEVRVSEAQLESLRSQAQSARAALRENQTALAWATLKAPVDGTVLSTNHRVGERIRGSDFSEDTVLVLGSMSTMDIKIEVGEHDVVHLKKGQRARIEIDALPNVPVEGEVTDIGRDAVIKNAGTDNEVINYPVWVALTKPPAAALAGMSGQVTVDTETHPEVVAVPIQAVTVRPRAAPDGGVATKAPATGRADKLEKVVFVVKDGKASRRRVTAGVSSETHLEILDGLQAGEEVVEGPYRVLARELKDGAAVKVDTGQPKKPGGPPAATKGH